jgi:hypothetical protein
MERRYLSGWTLNYQTFAYPAPVDGWRNFDPDAPKNVCQLLEEIRFYQDWIMTLTSIDQLWERLDEEDLNIRSARLREKLQREEERAGKWQPLKEFRDVLRARVLYICEKKSLPWLEE